MCRWIGGYGHVAVLSRYNSSSIINILDCPTDNLETLTFLFEHVNSGVPTVSNYVVL